MKIIILVLLLGYSYSQTCADGFVTGAESCDDGNTVSGDGCTASCNLETGWICEGGDSTQADTCSPDVGDNSIVYGVEECDDGNKVSGDGCSSNGLVEFSFVCF